MHLDGCVFKDPDPKAAALKLVERIRSSGEHPNFLLISYTYVLSGPLIREILLSELPGCPFIGIASQFGVFSNDPSAFADIPCLSAMVFYDPEGSYGIGSGSFGSDDKTELELEIRRTLASAGRKGEIPDLVFYVFGRVLRQQFVISTFENFFGNSIPVFGGGSGLGEEYMQCFTSGTCYTNEDFYAFVLFYPSCRIRTTYKSFYRIRHNKGIVSKTEGKTILEIDNRRALDVYRDWLSEYFPREFLEDDSEVFNELVFTHPLGVQTGLSSKDSNYRTYVVFSPTPEGGLKTYSHFKIGTRIFLMSPYSHDIMVQKFQEAVECIKQRKRCTKVYGMLTVTCYVIRQSLNSEEVGYLKNLDFPVCGFFFPPENTASSVTA